MPNPRPSLPPDWNRYLGRPGPSAEPELLTAVLDYIGSKMGGHCTPKQRRDARELRGLIARVRRITPFGRRLLLKDPYFWEDATLAPSCGGEIEEIKYHTGQTLKWYVRRYCRRR